MSDGCDIAVTYNTKLRDDLLLELLGQGLEHRPRFKVLYKESNTLVGLWSGQRTWARKDVTTKDGTVATFQAGSSAMMRRMRRGSLEAAIDVTCDT